MTYAGRFCLLIIGTGFCLLMNGLKDLQYWSWSSPDVIKEKGLEHVTVDDLVAEITPKGRGKEIQTQMSQYINKHTYLYFINILL